jgi:hypothetical protein
MKRMLFGWFGLLGVVGLALAAKVEADPGKEYPITPQAGGWLICAASYTGPESAQLAKELAFVIRRDMNWPAYVFDRGREERHKQQEQFQQLRQQNPERRFRIVRIEEQHAVLVGGYKDMESARRALPDFQKLAPPAKFSYTGIREEANDALMDHLRSPIPRPRTGNEAMTIKQVADNPFRYSFVVRNPTVPREPAPQASADPLLKKLNTGEALSLLNCKKPWTLVVANFQGPMVIQSRDGTGSSNRFIDTLLGKKARDHLDAGAQQAQVLAKALREMKDASGASVGFEAYVLHTRYASIVTVGGYDSPNDPKMAQDQQVLSKLKLLGTNIQDPSFHTWLPQPLPMEVPKP